MKKTILLFLFTVSLAWGLNAQALQKVVIEEHTGAWCGWCPDGALKLTDILNQQPNAIGVSIHQGDGMQISLSSLIRSFYNPAFPQATINRQGDPISRASWAAAVNTALTESPLVSVSFDSVVYEPVSRQLTARIKATFLRDTTGQMRVNMYILEDNVVGSGSGYDQVNYNNGTAGHPLQGLGDPILNYVHNHVLRDALGSAWGTVSVIPSTVTAGQEFTHTYTYIVPQNFDIDQIHLVAMVNYHGGQLTYQRPTLNAEQMPLSMATVGMEDGLTGDSHMMQVWPNPSNGRVNISFTMEEMGNVRVEVYNTGGQRVTTIADGFTNSGTHTVYWDGRDLGGERVPSGIYFVRMFTEHGENRAQRIMMQN